MSKVNKTKTDTKTKTEKKKQSKNKKSYKKMMNDIIKKKKDPKTLASSLENLKKNVGGGVPKKVETI